MLDCASNFLHLLHTLNFERHLIGFKIGICVYFFYIDAEAAHDFFFFALKKIMAEKWKNILPYKLLVGKITWVLFLYCFFLLNPTPCVPTHTQHTNF